MDVQSFKALLGQTVSIFVPQEIGHGFRYGIMVEGAVAEVTDSGVWIKKSGVRKFIVAETLRNAEVEVIEGDWDMSDESRKQPSEGHGQVYVGMAAFDRLAELGRLAELERQTVDPMDKIRESIADKISNQYGLPRNWLLALDAEDCEVIGNAFLDLAKQLKEAKKT